MCKISSVKANDDIRAVATMAREIWNEHYVPIIGQAQVDYMLQEFQSQSAIARQTAEGYQYYLVHADRQLVGYFALLPKPSEGGLFLSKIYIRSQWRGRGLGRMIISYAIEVSRELRLAEIRLTVNRHNAASIAFYERLGFVRDGTVVQDIGNGFVMDDYRMVMAVDSQHGGDHASDAERTR